MEDTSTAMADPACPERRDDTADVNALALRAPRGRTIALIGLMGAGKSAIGRRLAEALSMPFYDADEEIERAAGLKVSEIFSRHGEEEFRRGERAVIARLLDGPPHVLATGGGAYMDPQTRALLKQKAVTVWLRAELDVLMKRVTRRGDRPLLMVDDPRARLAELMAVRYPVYAEADIVADSNAGPHAAALTAVLKALIAHGGGVDAKA
jgi:shikimate kinase